VKGIILLGGFDDYQRSKLSAAFKDAGATVINAHNRKCSYTDPFLNFTASLRLASRLSKTKLVVVTSSWIDVLMRVLGVSSIAEFNASSPKYQSKVLNAWIIVSRVLDRVALRYGALYFLSKDATDLANGAFRGFSKRPGVLTLDKNITCVEDILLTLSISQCVHPHELDSMNLNGNISDADYLLVGDQINPKFKHFKHWPFHDDSASAFFITSVLQEVGVSEDKIAWANANHEDSAAIKKFLAHRNASVIALGKEAIRGLNSMGIVPKFSIPHPSWAKRFNKRDEYLKSLSSIFQEDNSFRIQLSPQVCALSS
jgi:hypothetical protein